MESERTRPDFTEVIEPEVAVKEMMSSPEKVIKDEVKIQSGQGLKRGALGAVIVEKRKVVKEIKPALPKEPNYVQNEEQNKDTIWNRTRENTAVEQTALPTITDNELKENFDIPITRQKFINYKNRLTSDEEYRQRIEARINDLITKIETGETTLEDLTPEDQKVIMDILNQNA